MPLKTANIIIFMILAIFSSVASYSMDATDYEQVCRQYAEEDQVVAEEELSAYMNECIDTLVNSEDENQPTDTEVMSEEDNAMSVYEEACLQSAEESQISDDHFSDYINDCIAGMVDSENEGEPMSPASESEEATDGESMSSASESEQATEGESMNPASESEQATD